MNGMLVVVDRFHIALIVVTVIKLAVGRMVSGVVLVMLIALSVVASFEISRVVSLEELDHEEVLLVGARILEPVEELSDTNVIVLQELNDCHLLAILHLLSHSCLFLQELSHRDIVVMVS